MNSKSRSQKQTVMIIGGGVAGMAAAQTLSDNDIHVHLVEKNNRLGGNAEAWSCMATDTCQHCAACLSPEMAANTFQRGQITTYLNAEISQVNRQGDAYTVCLKGNEDHPITADNIILATGFSPIKPNGLMGETYQSCSNIITTADLNELLKKNAVQTLVPGTPSPKIGFIQCVGSRNREKGRDYCSQVCCKISLRHINKLLHLYPDAAISLFYIDLQVIGKEARSKFDSLSKNVQLIQGVPFEIFTDKAEGKLSVIREDSSDGKRIADHFDMMVLSVGIQAREDNLSLLDMAGISTDQWGFANNTDLLAQKGIYVAGCAAGPADILTARQQGVRCAEKIIQSLQKEPAGKAGSPVAIIGDGNEAQKTASAVLKNGYEVWMFGQGADTELKVPGIHHVPDTTLTSLKGAAGHFTLSYSASGRLLQKPFSAMIVADRLTTVPAGQDIGLQTDHLQSLDQVLTRAEHHPETIPNTLVFWLDYSQPENKVFSRKALLLARELSQTGKHVTILMKKMLVHGLEGQKQYDLARKQGIKFLRVDSSGDVEITAEKGGIRYEVNEKTMPGVTLSFTSDWLILPDKVIPHPGNPAIAALLKEPIDTEGSLQSSNVRHRLIHSPRKGLFYTGACHDETNDQDQEMEIDAILSALRGITTTDPLSAGIEINTLKCKKCLTCYRVCPHGAIVLNENMKPYIVPEACFSCGLCLTSCPALAIESKAFPNEGYITEMPEKSIMVFACERSGALAAKQGQLDGRVVVQQVPCVCRISKSILLKTLENGAAKIVLAGCHPDNCRSTKGSQTAQDRTKTLTRFPGIDDSAVTWFPVAANETAKFEQFINQTMFSKEG